MEMFDFAAVLTIIGGLTILTNLIVEVIKPITGKFIPTELTAMLVAELLTILVFFAWMDWKQYPVAWYLVAAAVVLGLLVSYAAQFGFDKLQAALGQIGKGSGNGKT